MYNQVWSPRYKTEHIIGFYVVERQQKLFVLGESSGYIFPISKNFEDILVFSRKIDFMPHMSDFILKNYNSISGKVSLTANNKSISENDLKKLYDLGFKNSAYMDDVLVYELTIEDSRYNIEGELSANKLEKPYRVNVEQPDSGFDVARKIIATPGAIVIDTAVTLPTALLMVLIMSTDGL